MNPLRVLTDLFAPAARPVLPPASGCASVGVCGHCGSRGGGECQLLSERERLMRHTGLPECPIPEHAAALRRLGRVTMERDEARADFDLMVAIMEHWKTRAETAEAVLRHPCTGQERDAA